MFRLLVFRISLVSELLIVTYVVVVCMLASWSTASSFRLFAYSCIWFVLRIKFVIRIVRMFLGFNYCKFSMLDLLSLLLLITIFFHKWFIWFGPGNLSLKQVASVDNARPMSAEVQPVKFGIVSKEKILQSSPGSSNPSSTVTETSVDAAAMQVGPLFAFQFSKIPKVSGFIRCSFFFLIMIRD